MVELLEGTQTLVRHASNLFDGSLESREIVLQVLQRWSETIAEPAASIRKEEIAGKTAYQRANQRPCRNCRSLVHTRPPVQALRQTFQKRCHQAQQPADVVF